LTGTIKTDAAKHAEVGRDGVDVRSDLHVVFEPRETGGIAVEVESRVAPYYGEAIQAQVGQVLRELGVFSARVHIRDQGALPFTIAARLEAAVRRAGLGEGKRTLPQRVAQPHPSAKDRMRRSRLYLPGNEPKFFINAGLHGPDAIILDLEDSVHAAEKDTARILVRNALRSVSFGAAERMVRINQLPMGLVDLDEVIPEGPELVLLPKVERAEQVVEADRRIREISARCKLERPMWLMPILESALGIENAFSIVSASESVAALTIGLEDYTADLGVVKTTKGDESWYARLRLVNAARAAGVQAIDSVYGDVDDLDGLRCWGERSRALGFEGMGCIHPRQIPVIHKAFAPPLAEIQKALRIVTAFEEAQRRGLGVVSLGSKMIDAPVVHRALKLVDKAKALGLLPPEEGQ
jgi:citrate lyase subunit beta/citryl-CoA lyase